MVALGPLPYFDDHGDRNYATLSVSALSIAGLRFEKDLFPNCYFYVQEGFLSWMRETHAMQKDRCILSKTGCPRAL